MAHRSFIEPVFCLHSLLRVNINNECLSSELNIFVTSAEPNFPNGLASVPPVILTGLSPSKWFPPLLATLPGLV